MVTSYKAHVYTTQLHGVIGLSGDAELQQAPAELLLNSTLKLSLAVEPHDMAVHSVEGFQNTAAGSAELA